MNNLSIFDLSVFIVFAAILILASVCIFAVIMLNIQKELKYINLEIARTSGREQQYWRKRRKSVLRHICTTVALMAVLISVIIICLCIGC